MAKVTAPLFGFSASGRLNKALVYGSWRGIKYARMYAVPSNPRTPAQIAHRALFSAAVADWKELSPAEKDNWNQQASGRPLTGFNLFVRDHMATAS